MRFLHTGDWHVGKMLKGRNRLDEQAAVLAEIVDIARRERVDALLVGGDSFDGFSPKAEDERLVYTMLAECCGAGIPCLDKSRTICGCDAGTKLCRYGTSVTCDPAHTINMQSPYE